jgi:hypothetical protein
LLLRQLDHGLGLTRTLASAFTDRRDPRYCDHSLTELRTQRLYGMALGYDDLNDHDLLRRDPLLAAACGKRDPLGGDRLHAHDRGVALAGSSTLNRLELGNQKATRRHKISHDPAQVEACLLRMGVRCLDKHAREIVLDLDAMGHLVHGSQGGRHFSAYYDGYCYLPLYAFVGHVPLWAELRPGDADAACGVVAALEKMVAAIRKRCKKARIVVRADSAFAREEIMAWCEQQKPGVYYCVGLGPNSRLREMIAEALAAARARRCLTGAASARGEMENVFKQQVLDLPGDRMSTHWQASNQLRLWLATLAYLLMERLRAVGLAGTELAVATVGTIRLRLLKVAASVRVSVRRVSVQMSSAYPLQRLFRRCAQRLGCAVAGVT